MTRRTDSYTEAKNIQNISAKRAIYRRISYGTRRAEDFTSETRLFTPSLLASGAPTSSSAVGFTRSLDRVIISSLQHPLQPRVALADYTTHPNSRRRISRAISPPSPPLGGGRLHEKASGRRDARLHTRPPTQIQRIPESLTPTCTTASRTKRRTSGTET